MNLGLNRDLMKKGLRPSVSFAFSASSSFESRPYEEGIKTDAGCGMQSHPAV